MRYFVFNETDSRQHGYLLELERSILPPLNPVFVRIPRRAGAYVPQKHSRDIESLSFKIKLGLLGNNPSDFREKARQIARWLFNANNEGQAQPIWFSDEPQRIYNVWISGSVDLDEVAATGEIDIVFIATDPFANATSINTSTFATAGANLIPRTDFSDLSGDFTDWYGNQAFWKVETSGEDTMRIMLTNHGANPRMRVLSSPTNMADLVAGQTYTVSYVILDQSPELIKLELLGVYHYGSDLSWQTFPSVHLTDLPYYDEKEGSRLYEYTFTSTQTGGARLSIGFGLANATKDGSEYKVKNIKIEEGSSRTAFKHGGTDPAKYVSITNEGTYKTYPDFKITPTATLNYLRIGKKDKHIYINRTLAAWDDIIVNNRTNEIYIEDTGESLLPYTTISSRFFDLEAEKNHDITIRSSSVNFGASINWQEKYV